MGLQKDALGACKPCSSFCHFIFLSAENEPALDARGRLRCSLVDLAAKRPTDLPGIAIPGIAKENVRQFS